MLAQEAMYQRKLLAENRISAKTNVQPALIMLNSETKREHMHGPG